MRHLTISLIVILMPVLCFAQTLISGTVTHSSDGTPVVGANVLIKNNSGKIIKFTFTDNNGCFSIKADAPSEVSYINITMIGLKPYSAPLNYNDKALYIMMDEDAMSLDEVVVKGEPIRENGDTVTYYVTSFAQKQDRTIGDVLNRMPGIDVASNGKIQYQGIDINKFYIEGNDLLGGKYGIATNGISYEDIGAIEVLENHEPMQVLRGLSFSDQAAINLKLKNSAKASFLIHGNIGGGWSEYPRGLLLDGDIFTMMVTGKYQMLTTFKGNNTGHNLSDQLLDFTGDKSDESLQSYLNLNTPSTPNLQKKRTYFNRSWMASSSHLWKTKNNGEVRAQIDYSSDKYNGLGESHRTYFLNSGDKVIIEKTNSMSHNNTLMGKFSYETNQKTYFLNNTLFTDLTWNDLALNTIGTLVNTQNAETPSYSVRNHLKIIKRYKENKLITFLSKNEYQYLPENLTIKQSEFNYGQFVGQRSFYTDERASFGFVFNKLLLSMECGVTGYLRQLDTELWGIELSDVINQEQLSTNYLRFFVNPKLEWKYRKFEISLDSPINLYTYFFSDAMKDRTEIFASPSLAVKWKMSPRMSLILRGSARRSPASLYNIHNSSILTDYRTFNTGIDDYYASSGQSVSASLNYRNVPEGVFASIIGSYTWNQSKYIPIQNVVDDYVFYSYQNSLTNTNGAISIFNITKTLDFMRGTIGVKGLYSYQNNYLLSQGEPTQYSNNLLTITPFVNGNISSYVNWDFKFTWERNDMNILNGSNHTTNNFVYYGSLTITPCDFITWTTGGEFYNHQLSNGGYKGLLMLDTKLTFVINKHIEISASVSNIFNNQYYNYITYSTISRFEHSSRLRGREFMISLYLKK